MESFLRSYSTYRKIRNKRKRRDHELSENIRYLKNQNISLKKLDNDYLKKLNQFNRTYLGGYKRTDWNQFFITVSDIKSEKFIPLDLFQNYIVPQMNNVRQIPAYEDKNIYDLIFREYNRPPTLLRYSQGQFLNSEFTPVSISKAEQIFKKSERDLFVKPSWRNTGRGRGIKKFENTEFDKLIDYLNKNREAFIIQKTLDQHSKLKNLHPQSINTIKLVTVRFKHQIEFLCSRFRIGRQGNYIDEMGYFLGVDQNGFLNPIAYDHSLKVSTHHENTGVQFDGTLIPAYQEAINMCKRMHERLLHFDIVSWDIAIDEKSKPVLIEFNLGSPGILFLQIVNGPFFGRYTEEILSEIKYNFLVNA